MPGLWTAHQCAPDYIDHVHDYIYCAEKMNWQPSIKWRWIFWAEKLNKATWRRKAENQTHTRSCLH